MTTDERRAEILRSFGAEGGDLEALLDYNESRFELEEPPLGKEFPLPDEDCVAAWEGCMADAARVGAIAALRPHLSQLAFPIAEGMSQAADYVAAIRRGALPEGLASATGLELRREGEIEIFIHPTPAGRVPVLAVPDREDFVALYRALGARNEPVAVPASVNAALIGGLVNRGRMRALRAAWEQEHAGASAEEWSEHFFGAILPEKRLFQDRVILLGDAPYSGVAGSELGFEEGEWLRVSRTIRLEHECAHYFTRRALGAMSNRLLDEIIADYAGVRAAAGRYRADWFLRFMGLEAAPGFRQSGRLAHYRGEPPLGDSAFRILQALAVAAARNAEKFDAEARPAFESVEEKGRALMALASLTVEEMACAKGAELIAKAWERVRW